MNLSPHFSVTPSTETAGAHIVVYYADAAHSSVIDIRECSCSASDHAEALKASGRASWQADNHDVLVNVARGWDAL